MISALGLKAIGGVIGIAALAGAVFYVVHLIETRAVERSMYERNIEVQMRAAAKREADLKEIEAQAQAAEEAKAVAEAKIAKSRERVKELEEHFARHDLAELARQEPKAIEERIGAATRKIFSDFAQLHNSQ